MFQIQDSQLIHGVQTVDLRQFKDDRGYFLETFRKEWFPQRNWGVIQTNCSFSQAGVLRGLHYHAKQVDYWFVPVGEMRVGMCDLRRSSPTYLTSQTIEMGEQHKIGLFIPSGVAHGFLALTDVYMTYLVDNYYDGDDEFGVAWDDPALNLDWQLTTPPFVSARDRQNPSLNDIPPESLPE